MNKFKIRLAISLVLLGIILAVILPIIYQFNNIDYTGARVFVNNVWYVSTGIVLLILGRFLLN